MLAVGPGHLFHRDAARRAIDPSHHVEEEHAQPPERHELEAARRQAIVHAAAAATSRTPWTIATMGRDRDGQGESADLLLEVHRAIDESALLLNPVQDSLDLHPAVGLRERLASSTAILAESTRDASSIAAPWSRVEADGSVDAQNAPTDPCKTTERFRTSSHTPHRCLSFRTTSDRNLSVCWGSDPQILRRRRSFLPG